VSAMVELVDRAQRGDPDAHGLIYGQYRPLVFRFIWRKVHNKELAEDLTQDTFVRAMRSIDRFTWQGRDLGAWLYTIARNLIADYFKSSAHRTTVSVADFGDAGISPRDTALEGDPETAVLDAIRDADLRNSLELLTIDQRQCLTYRYLNQLSIAETGELMGRNEASVKSLTYRAVQALMRFLFRAVTR
jgi:RNA polymerase sigma-70 factor, ECF subfamily